MMSDDLVKRLRYGIVEHRKRWSGDTHADLGGSVDYDATTDMLHEAADRIEELEAKLAKNEALMQAGFDDLVKRLRDWEHVWPDDMDKPAGHLYEDAADRIEELEAENRLLRDAVYIDDRTVTMQANDRSKAMTAIRRALDFLNADMPTEAKTALRTTLAELTGGKDG